MSVYLPYYFPHAALRPFQVLLRARHPQQGRRAAARLPVRRHSEKHRRDRLQRDGQRRGPVRLATRRQHRLRTRLTGGVRLAPSPWWTSGQRRSARKRRTAIRRTFVKTQQSTTVHQPSVFAISRKFYSDRETRRIATCFNATESRRRNYNGIVVTCEMCACLVGNDHRISPTAKLRIVFIAYNICFVAIKSLDSSESIDLEVCASRI